MRYGFVQIEAILSGENNAANCVEWDLRNRSTNTIATTNTWRWKINPILSRMWKWSQIDLWCLQMCLRSEAFTIRFLSRRMATQIGWGGYLIWPLSLDVAMRRRKWERYGWTHMFLMWFIAWRGTNLLEHCSISSGCIQETIVKCDHCHTKPIEFFPYGHLWFNWGLRFSILRRMLLFINLECLWTKDERCSSRRVIFID